MNLIKTITFYLIFTTVLGLQTKFAQAVETVSVIGVGDIMLGTNYPSAKYLPPNEGRGLLKNVKAILQSADVTFGNLEGSILDQGATIKTDCKKCYAFRMPENLAPRLEEAGFDLLSIANNHARDFGDAGLKNTIKVLTNLGIETAGLTTRPTATVIKNGVRYGFAAFAPNVGTVQITELAEAQKIVRELDKTHDIVIVSFHGGAEGISHQSVPKKTEYYYDENRGNVYQFAHTVIDAGADIVFGHGPHVVRAIEVYKQRFIAYSLGNFCTYRRFNLRGVKNIAPIIKVNVDKTTGQFVGGQIISARQSRKTGVVIRDAGNRAVSTIRKLTRKDGFLHNLKITANGLISYVAK